MDRLSRTLAIVAVVTAGLLAMSEVKYLTGPVVFRTRFAHGAVDETGPTMRLSCSLPPDGRHWERGLYTGGLFYDMVLKDHPIGSSSDALLRDVKRQGYRVTECGNGYHATASHSPSFLIEAVAEIAWKHDVEGRIAEVGVQYGMTGP